MATALIAVDVQPDFIDGPLGGEGRGEVIEPIKEMAADVDVVVATADWHPEDHCSFAEEPEFADGSWPKHCVAGTAGANVVGEISRVADIIIHKGTVRDQEAYSGFDPGGLASYLGEKGIGQVIVTGLCTDYCVKETAVDAAEAGFDVIVPLAACRGVAKDTTNQAVQEMKAAGVHIEE